jgi:transposase-like protein
MSILMNKEKIQALANELGKDIKTPDDLSQLSAILTKMTVEAALKCHLGYDKNQPVGSNNGNYHNGYSSKITEK